MKPVFMSLFMVFMSLLIGCASVTPVASVIGATASVTDAYWTYTSLDDVVILSRECLWYRKIKLTEESKKGMVREDKEQLAFLNLMYDRPIEEGGCGM